MKLQFFPLMTVLGFALVAVGEATNTSMSLVSHPVNLGAHADPLRIPISQVPVWSNYSYRTHIGNPIEGEKASASLILRTSGFDRVRFFRFNSGYDPAKKNDFLRS